MARHVVVLRRVEDFHQAGTGPDFTETELTLEQFAELFEVTNEISSAYPGGRKVLAVRDEVKERFK